MAEVKVVIPADILEQLAVAMPEIARTKNNIIARALNDVARSTRTQFVRTLQKNYNLTSQRGIRRNTKLIRANAKRLAARLTFTGRRIPLVDFGGRWLNKNELQQFLKSTNEARKKFRPPKYKIFRDTGTKSVERGFIATMPKSNPNQKRGHKGIFRRGFAGGKGGSVSSLVGRLPIFEVFGPSVPQIVETLPGVLENAEEFGREKIAERLLAHVNLTIERAIERGNTGRASRTRRRA